MEYRDKDTGNVMSGILEDRIDINLFAESIKSHLAEVGSDRKSRFINQLGISYKRFVDLLVQGKFSVEAAIQETSAKGTQNDLMIALRRSDTDIHNQQYAIMILSDKSKSTLFPPTGGVFEYMAGKAKQGVISEGVKYMTPRFYGDYANKMGNEGYGQNLQLGYKSFEDPTNTKIKNKFEMTVKTIAQSLKGS